MVNDMTHDQKKYSYVINGKPAATTDRTPLPAQILVDAGFEPAEDYLLIMRTQHGSKALQSDEVVELNEQNDEFYAFAGGVIFSLTVNGHLIYWGADKIAIDNLRDLANVSESDDLVWMREEEGNVVLPLQGDFALSGQGVEHLKTHPRPDHGKTYRFFVEDVEYVTREHELTGAQIMAMIPDWDPANSLVLEGEGAEADEVIRPTTTVVFNGRKTEAHFAIVPPATFG
jgi:hypothetical protein